MLLGILKTVIVKTPTFLFSQPSFRRWKLACKPVLVAMLSLAYMSVASFSAFGDDIEIYYGISDQNQVINPNVIFILDTSGSMADTDGGSVSRMNRTKDALKIALNSVSDVNISLMRFSDNGGRILNPALDIEAAWDTYEVVKSISGEDDFAFELPNGRVETDISSVDLFTQNYNRHHGLKFRDMNIPDGAIIESAHLTYFSAENNFTNFSRVIRYVAHEPTALLNPTPEFSDGTFFNNLLWYPTLPFLGAAPRTTTPNCNDPSQAICWSPTIDSNSNGNADSNWPSLELPVNTVDLSSLIQTVIDNPEWAPGNDIVLFGEGIRLNNENGNGEGYGVIAIGDNDGEGFRKMAPQLRVRYRLPGTIEPTYTVRDYILSSIESLVASGGTPVTDSMFEAFSYINGLSVPSGGTRGTSARRASYARLSHPDTIVNPNVLNNFACNTENLTSLECRFRRYANLNNLTYDSPIDEELGQCQANYIVLFSDGASNNTFLADEISEEIGIDCSGEQCANVLAEYMATKPSERNNDKNHAQTFTYTVGFESEGFDTDYLRDLAEDGQGSFFSGNTSAELASYFTQILIEAKKGASTFVAPGISVNQFNRLTHSNDIYYALFDPRTKEYWPGNLKKYKLIDSVVLDNTSTAAISTDGFFRDDAHDWWSTSSSLAGVFVARGGAASQQQVARQVYTNIGTVTSAISANDSRITEERLGIEGESNSAALRTNLIDWIRGYDVQDLDEDGVILEPRFQMADPLHSEPLFYQYGEHSSVYIGTNEGYLLSIDAETGTENWAFIPEDLLKNIPIYFENANVFNTRTYGMDGAINAWTEDGKNYLIVGQRRGGRNYFVFDITDRLNPVYKYAIEGGVGEYTNLGQSWSKPTVTSIDDDGTVKKVLIFGGGYDTDQDFNDERESDDLGNSVYIVEAQTGDKLAEISGKSGTDIYTISGMNNSIPSRIAVIDKDFDGNVDHLYYGDMGGHLYRVDIYNGQALSSMFNGQRIYTSSLPNSETKNRRFYYAPDIAEITYKGDHYFAVTIGSGYRAHPLNETIQDSVLMLKDHGVFTLDTDNKYTFPSFTNIAQISPSVSSVTDINSYDGYEFNFVAGEKVITGVSIINSKLVFSTYDPSTAGIIDNSCSAAQGGGRIYAINLLDGQALLDNNEDGVVDYQDTFVELKKSGIPAEPRIIITDPNAPTLCVGTECADTIQSDDDANDFEDLLGRITGPQSRLNQIFTNSWSTDIEPSTQDDN